MQQAWRVGLIVVLVSTGAVALAQTLEDRVRELERRVEALEKAMAGRSSGGDGGSARGSEPAQPSPIRARLVRKAFREADVLAGDTLDRLIFTLNFENQFDRDVRAFAGILVFKDPFDQEILRVRISEPDGIRAHGRLLWEGWIGYHDFNKAHRRLRNLKIDDTTADFLLEKVVFADGARKSYPVVQEGPSGPPVVAERTHAGPVAGQEPAAGQEKEKDATTGAETKSEAAESAAAP